MRAFKYKKLIEVIKKDFVLDYDGDHGMSHWVKVYKNTQKLSRYYDIQSDVFELFSLCHT